MFVLRLAAFKAYHDTGECGLSPGLIDQILGILAPLGRVFIVSESPLPVELAGYRLPCAASRLHHVLAACNLVVGDGLTVPVEAALLGRPAVVFGSYISKNAYVRALQRDFGLIDGFKPGQEADCIARIRHLTSGPSVLQDWAQRRAAMLSVWSDPH